MLPCPFPAPTAHFSKSLQPEPRAALEPFRRQLTLALLARLQAPGLRALVAQRLAQGRDRIALIPLLADFAAGSAPAAGLALLDPFLALDRELRRRQGLAGFPGPVLGLEWVWPRSQPRILDWDQVLLAIAPQGPAELVTEIQAYDLQGRLYRLDPHQPPAVPVLVAGSDRGAIKRAGIALLNAGFQQFGLAPLPVPASGVIACSKLTCISLTDSHEPWWKGAAEVYAITSGVDPTVAKPSLQVLDLPYLAYDQRPYYPNQLILFWNQYRFNAANFQLWEQDDATNYQELLSRLLEAVGLAMTAAGAPSLAWIPALAEAIIKAMPADWLTDSDDYLDSFYTLERGRRYEQLVGVAGNAVIDLEPFELKP